MAEATAAELATVAESSRGGSCDGSCGSCGNAGGEFEDGDEEALTLSKCRLDFSRCFSTIDGVFNLNGSDIGKVSVNIELVDECRCGGVDSSRGVVVVVGLEPWRCVVVDIIVGVCVGDAAMFIIGVCVDNCVLLDATQDGICL